MTEPMNQKYVTSGFSFLQELHVQWRGLRRPASYAGHCVQIEREHKQAYLPEVVHERVFLMVSACVLHISAHVFEVDARPCAADQHLQPVRGTIMSVTHAVSVVLVGVNTLASKVARIDLVLHPLPTADRTARD